jgi:hypothetical protein
MLMVSRDGGAYKCEADLRWSIGDALFDEQQSDRLNFIAAIEEGLLSRGLFVGANGAEARPSPGEA